MKNNHSYWSIWLLAFVIIWMAFFLTIPEKPLELLSSQWPFIFIGFGGALLGNISAVGGGIIFIPSMMFIFHLDPVTALKVALLSQCFGMTSGALTWIKKVKIPSQLFILTIPALMTGSIFSSLIIHPSPLLVKVFFGPVSIGLGILTLFLMRKKKRDELTDLQLSSLQKTLLIFTSFIGGLITGWVAIGEGEVVAALLMLGFNLSASISIALGVVLLSINSLFLAIIHQFYLGGLPWEIAAFTGFGCVFGARLAPFLAKRIDQRYLKIIFAVITIADGSLFVFQYLFSKGH